MTQLAQIEAALSVKGSGRALAGLLRELKRLDYDFTTPTPETHKRVIARKAKAGANDLRDVFGWSLPFEKELLPQELIKLMFDAGIVIVKGSHLQSRLRVSRLGDDLFYHSAFPTNEKNSVFFGPDTYRFAAFLREQLADRRLEGLLVDIGAGSGAGAVVAAKLTRPERLVMTDTNPEALELARVNAACAGVGATMIVTNGLDAVADDIDLIIANPPFIAGNGTTEYRDGGDLHGARLSLDWAKAAAAKLAPGGLMVMYTGTAIIDGVDPFSDALKAQLPRSIALTYRELDPDIFGEQLDDVEYQDVERIAAVGLTLRREI